MTKFSNKILESIHENKVTPKSRKYFIFIHTLISLVIFGMMVVGSLGIAIVIRTLMSIDWELARHLTGGHLKSLLILTPYLWIFFIILLILIADMIFRNSTKRGYRYKTLTISIVSAIIILLGGNILFAAKADRPVEDALRKHFSPYQTWEREKEKMFAAPEKGVVAGEIKRITQDKEIIIVDFKGREWKIDISKEDIRPEFIPEVGMRIGIMGRKVDDRNFEPKNIRAWGEDMETMIRQKEAIIRREQKMMKENLIRERIR